MTDATVQEVAEVTEETEGPEEIRELTEKLEAAEAKAAEYLDGWQRARAELSNYKKRVEKEQAQFGRYANASLITRLLPVLDDFERAFHTLPGPLRELTWIEGAWLIERKLEATLQAEGVEPIDAVGKPFDPTVHEAIMHQESREHEEGTVIAEVQKGYRLHDRVLRPSLVVVAKAPEEKVDGAVEATQGVPSEEEATAGSEG